MAAVLWVTVAVVAVWGGSVCAQAPGDLPPTNHSHSVVLDQESGFVMMWTPHHDSIEIEVRVGAKGYVGLGFSPNGGMKGADIVLGWVDAAGEVFLHDRYAEGNRAPKIDDSQNVELLGGYENDTHTVLRFARPWDTCDEGQDFKLTDDTVRVIWAYSNTDPASETDLHYHEARGTKSLYLKAPQFAMPQLGPDVKTWDFFAPNIALPDHLDTLYWCKIYKVPPMPVKTHMIGYVPLIEEKNLEHVHHILFYECYVPNSDTHFEKWLNWEGTQCYSANMPVSWHYCKAPLVAWGIGGEGEMFPEHAGFPLGEEHGGSTYFMMEIHYDNPNLRQGVVDSSGIRVFYTENVREFDAGILSVGHNISPELIVPPFQSEFMTSGICDPSCTQAGFPKDGVKMFQGLLHAHLLGTSLVLRHIRGGRELPPIMTDKNYDFNYQSTRILREEVTVLPGDTLITECSYDSSGRRKPTFGGLSTTEEMCLAFMSYYPRVNLSWCVSEPQLSDVVGALGVNYTHDIFYESGEADEQDATETAKSGDVNQELKPLKLFHQYKTMKIAAPEKFANMSVFSVLHDEATWKDPAVTDSFSRLTRGVQTGICRSRNAYRKTEISYPSIRQGLAPEPSPCVRNGLQHPR